MHNSFTFLPAKVTTYRDFNKAPKIEPGWIDVLASGKKQNYKYSVALRRKYDGTRDEMPVCHNYMKHKLCTMDATNDVSITNRMCDPEDQSRCGGVVEEEPLNCADSDDAPERSERKKFRWCETTEEWSPPAFGEDVVIKAGWIVVLDGECLTTNITRHIKLFGSLLLKDPGHGKTVTLKAQTIVVETGTGYLEAGTVHDPIMEGDVRVELYGNRHSNAKYSYGLENKYLSIFGHLSLVGMRPANNSLDLVTWGTLQKDTDAEEDTISVESHLCSAWWYGDILMVGGGTPKHTAVTKTSWDTAERCIISQIESVPDLCKISCQDKFVYDHSGPKMKAGATFNGVPVTLASKGTSGGVVGIFGMEDEQKALEEQGWGAVVQVVAPQSGVTGKRELRDIVNAMRLGG